MRRCTRCIFPDSVPGISFDDKGVCNYCLNYEPIEYYGEQELSKKIDRAKSLNNRYDCIVPISGGKDSTYVLYMATKVYNLRALAVHYDNGFKKKQAFVNIRNACKKLGADFLNYHSNKDIDKKIIRAHIKNSLAKDPLGTNFCSACEYGCRAVAYKNAIKYQVPLVLWGHAGIENVRLFIPDEIFSSHLRKLRRRMGYEGIKVSLFELMQRKELPVEHNFINNLMLKYPRLKSKNIEEIRLFDYIPWNRKKIKETVTKHAGWMVPKSSISSWRTDCKIEALRHYVSWRIFGCSARAFGYHNMINEGQMTREEAMMQENNEERSFDSLRKIFEKDIGLRDSEIESIKNLK